MQNKKVVLITGAAKGIGRATALKFAAHGFCLTLVDKDAAALQSIGAEIEAAFGKVVLLRGGDLSDFVFLQTIVNQTIETFGRVNLVINNAAWRTIQTLRTMDLATWNETLNVCLTAPAFLAKWTAEAMEKQQTGGVIISISSMMAVRPAGNSPAYIAAKGGLETLTKELAVTYGRSNIRAICLQLGFIDTDMSRDYRNTEGSDLTDSLTNYLLNASPLRRAGSPEEVAETIFWLCSDAASFITGTTLLIDGGFTHNMNDYALKKGLFPDEY